MRYFYSLKLQASTRPILANIFPLWTVFRKTSFSTLHILLVQGNLRMGSDTTMFPALWADTATNISMGDLLKETSRKTEANHSDPLPVDKGSCLSQIPFNSDSFDAAIAAHIYRHQGTGLSTPVFHTSIWDAEETCHAFPFQKIENSRNEVVMPSQNTASGPSSQIADLNSMRSPESVKFNFQLIFPFC